MSKSVNIIEKQFVDRIVSIFNTKNSHFQVELIKRYGYTFEFIVFETVLSSEEKLQLDEIKNRLTADATFQSSLCLLESNIGMFVASGTFKIEAHSYNELENKLNFLNLYFRYNI